MNRNAKLDLVTRIFYRSNVKDLWYQTLKELTNRDSAVLEIGSGSGKGMQNTLYPPVADIVGIDLDERVLENPYLSTAKHTSAYCIAEEFKGQKFDVIYSNMVAEHIDDGLAFIDSQARLLAPGGVILHSTVSRYYWVSMINKFTPIVVKNWLIKNIGSGREADDIFPTHYRLNSTAAIRKICAKTGLEYRILRQDEPPGYVRRSLILMLIYTAIHKPLQKCFHPLRHTFIFLLAEKNSF